MYFNFFTDALDQIGSVFYAARETIFPRSWNIFQSLKRPSKYQLSINFLGYRKTVFPSSKKFKKRIFQDPKQKISIDQ